VLNGINLAIKRVSYKRSGRLGGRPRTHGVDKAKYPGVESSRWQATDPSIGGDFR